MTAHGTLHHAGGETFEFALFGTDADAIVREAADHGRPPGLGRFYAEITDVRTGEHHYFRSDRVYRPVRCDRADFEAGLERWADRRREYAEWVAAGGPEAQRCGPEPYGRCGL